MDKKFDFHDFVYGIIKENSKNKGISKTDLLKEFSYFRINKKIADKVLLDLERQNKIAQSRGRGGYVSIRNESEEMQKIE
jgi:hypothetical protein